MLNASFAPSSSVLSITPRLPRMGSEGEGFAASEPYTTWEQKLPLSNPKQRPWSWRRPSREPPARVFRSAARALPGAGRLALRAGVVGQLRDGAHRVPGGPYARRAAATTGGTPARTLQLLTLGGAPSPPPAGLRTADRVSPLAPKPPTSSCLPPLRPGLETVWGGGGSWSFSPTFWQTEVPTPVRFAQARVEPGSRACSPPYLLKPESWGLAEGAEAPGSRCKGRFCDSAYPGTQAPPGQEMSNEEWGWKAGAGRVRLLYPRGRRRYPSPGHPGPTRSISSATSPVGSPLHTTVCPDAPPLRTPAQGRGRMAEASQPPGPAAPPASSGRPLCRDPTRRGP